MLTTEQIEIVCERVLSNLPETLGADERFRRLVEGIASEVGDRAQGQRLDRIEAALERLAEAQVRTEERVGHLETAVEALAEAQRCTEERLGRLETAVEALAEAQRRTEERVEALAEAQRRTEERVGALAEAQRRTEERLNSLVDTVGRLRGDVFELKYRDRVDVYFGPLLRRVKFVQKRSLEDLLESQLTHEELLDVLRLDLLVGGQPRRREPRKDALLAVEVSAVIDRNDVERARRRCELLRKAGLEVIPAVAGEDLTRGAEESAAKQCVAVIRDGTTAGWEEALAHWLLPAPAEREPSSSTDR